MSAAVHEAKCLHVKIDVMYSGIYAIALSTLTSLLL